MIRLERRHLPDARPRHEMLLQGERNGAVFRAVDVCHAVAESGAFVRGGGDGGRECGEGDGLELGCVVFCGGGGGEGVVEVLDGAGGVDCAGALFGVRGWVLVAGWVGNIAICGCEEMGTVRTSSAMLMPIRGGEF